jgi:cell division septation protein DedD
MRTKAWLSGIIVTLALGLALMGATLAQTTTAMDVLNFEVISVEGNKLVIRDQNGSHEVTVPADFQFTVDGKKISVSELKPGMKGTATVTTTTTIKPVTITEVREVEVTRVSDLAVTVRGSDGEYRRYSQGELDRGGVEIIKDGKTIRLADLKRGDKLTATIVTSGPPTVLTAKEVEATLADSTAATAPTQVAAATGTAQPAAPATAPAAAPQPAAASPAPPAASGMGLTWWVIIAIVLAVVVFFFMRRRKAP